MVKNNLWIDTSKRKFIDTKPMKNCLYSRQTSSTLTSNYSKRKLVQWGKVPINIRKGFLRKNKVHTVCLCDCTFPFSSFLLGLVKSQMLIMLPWKKRNYRNLFLFVSFLLFASIFKFVCYSLSTWKFNHNRGWVVCN